MAVVSITLIVWAVCEAGLRIWETAEGRGHLGRDQWTRVLIGLTLGGSVGGALALRAGAPSWRIGGPSWAIGSLVMWGGLGLRAWAVSSLGRSFRTTVEVDEGQPVVTTGPYRWVRHPSYTGLLLIVVGCGIAVGNGAALALTLVVPLPAMLRRIAVEEAELRRVLGDSYAAYQLHTARLIPRVW